jgi:hypothetical protein
MSAMTTVQNRDSPPTGEDLNAAELALLAAAATGKLADLTTGDPNVDSLANVASWAAHRDVSAEFLADMLTGDRTIDSGRLRVVKLRGARITGLLDLEGRKLLCPLQLRDCHFEEPINLNDAEACSIQLRGCHVPAFNADSLRTAGSVALDYGFTARGEVRMTGARIGGHLSLRQATLTNEKGKALTLDALTVDQNMYADESFTARGEVSMIAAHIGGQFSLNDASLTCENGEALSAHKLTVGVGMYCRALVAHGEVNMIGAHVGGTLDLTRATLANQNGEALTADNLTVDGPVYFRALVTHGEVRLPGAHIGGQFDLSGASLENRNGRALTADGLIIDNSMHCRDGFTAHGEIRLLGVQIGWQLDLSGASLDNENGRALSAGMLTVNEGMYFLKVTVRGEVNLVRAQIGGQLVFDGASLANEAGMTLDARMLNVDTDVAFNKFSAHGGICMVRAQIGGQLDLRGARLTNSALALDLEAASARILCLPRERPEGGINLTNAKVVVLDDDPTGWPPIVFLRGFACDTFKSRDINTRTRLQWLRRHPGRFTPQLYDQLAAVYRQAGEEGAARKVAIANQWRRRRTFSLLSWLWYITVGYGYRTWQALIWLAVLTVAGSVVFSGAYPAHMLAPNAHPPRFQPVVYTLDLLLPVVGLGQKSAWQPATSGLMDWYWGLTAAGWVLGAAVVAGLTGILKRD